MTDFTYKQCDSLFVQIMPETPEATKLWNEEIAPKTSGTGKVLSVEFPLVKSQLTAAGYSIRKAVAAKQSDADLLDSLLN